MFQPKIFTSRVSYVSSAIALMGAMLCLPPCLAVEGSLGTPVEKSQSDADGASHELNVTRRIAGRPNSSRRAWPDERLRLTKLLKVRPGLSSSYSAGASPADARFSEPTSGGEHSLRNGAGAPLRP